MYLNLRHCLNKLGLHKLQYLISDFAYRKMLLEKSLSLAKVETFLFHMKNVTKIREKYYIDVRVFEYPL